MLNKVTCLRPSTLLKKKLWYSCFPVNFAKFPRTSFLQNTSGRLLLECLIYLICKHWTGFVCRVNSYTFIKERFCLKITSLMDNKKNSNAWSNPGEFYYRRRDVTFSLFLNFFIIVKIRVEISYCIGQIQAGCYTWEIQRYLFLKEMYNGNFCENRRRIKATVNLIAVKLCRRILWQKHAGVFIFRLTADFFSQIWLWNPNGSVTRYQNN